MSDEIGAPATMGVSHPSASYCCRRLLLPWKRLQRNPVHALDDASEVISRTDASRLARPSPIPGDGTQPGKRLNVASEGIRDPRKILDEAAKTLDFGQPVAIMILMTLQYVPDADDPSRMVRTLVDAVPPGSYLAISDVARDLTADRLPRPRSA